MSERILLEAEALGVNTEYDAGDLEEMWDEHEPDTRGRTWHGMGERRYCVICSLIVGAARGLPAAMKTKPNV